MNSFLNSLLAMREKQRQSGGGVTFLATVRSKWISAALLWSAAASASAAPIIFNQPFSANPGDLISVTGSAFGSAPQVYLMGLRQRSATLVATKQASDQLFVIQIPTNFSFDAYKLWVANETGASEPVLINAPRAMHYDAPRVMAYNTTTRNYVDVGSTPLAEVAGGDRFRMFGRNLYVNATTPTVSFIDADTSESLAAAVTTGGSDSYALNVTAPAALTPGKTYKVSVSNGYASAVADISIRARAGGGVDYYGLGVPWGRDFIVKNGSGYDPANPGVNESQHHIYNVKNDRVLKKKAVGDGVTDDTAAIQAAVDLAAQSGGGFVYLPAGTYRLASPTNTVGVTIRAGVVLLGHGPNDTTIVYGPSGPQPSNYVFHAIAFEGNRVGIMDVTLINTDTTGLNIFGLNNSYTLPFSELFVQNTKWILGARGTIALPYCSKIAIENSTFQTLANAWPTWTPIGFSNSANVLLRNNTMSFGFIGSVNLSWINNLIMEGNHLTRYSAGSFLGLGRQLSFNFIQNSVVLRNTFDVSGGVLPFQNADGETINSEGGGAAHPNNDTGTVAAATSTTVTDNARCSTCVWRVAVGNTLALVSGKGAGQWRRIVGWSGNTFTLDQPWQITPQPGDHFATNLPSLENVQIRYNTLQNNPAGIVLYGANMFRNVAITNNSFSNNGGITLGGQQREMTGPVSFVSGNYRNIEVKNNTLTNTLGQWASYINAGMALIASSYFGNQLDGVEVRSNKITAHAPLNPRNYVYTGNNGNEGYQNQVDFQGKSAYLANGIVPVRGTIFQNNTCVNCTVDYRISGGTIGTAIWNPINPSGAAVTILDKVFGNWDPRTTGVKSLSTVLGK